MTATLRNSLCSVLPVFAASTLLAFSSGTAVAASRSLDVSITECGQYPSDGIDGPLVDWYHFHVDEEQLLRLETSDGNGGCEDVSIISLYDAAYGFYDSNYGGGIGVCSRLITWIPAGDYHIGVRGLTYRRVGPYVLDFYIAGCSTCGNGMLEAELCDDGNTADGDGCSGLCWPGPVVLDHCGSYELPGRQGYNDEFEFSLTSVGTVRLETSDGNGGCNGDTSLVVSDAPYHSVAFDSDGGVGRCSRIHTQLPADDYSGYVSADHGVELGPYVLEFFTDACSICGNGDLEAESCDDGNRIDGDGCDSDCGIEFPELACGAFASSGIADGESESFAITLPEPSTIGLETSDGSGGCPGDTQILVRDASGVSIAGDGNGGVGACSRLVASLPAGSFAVDIQEYLGNSLDPYVLKYFSPACSTCGNAIEENEECDDGNSVDDDGCNSECERVPMHLGECGTYESPGFTDRDNDDYTFSLPVGGTVSLTVTDDNGGCAAIGSVYLYDDKGDAYGGSGDDKTGPCVMALSLPAGDYAVEVYASIPRYSIDLRNETCTVCGNGILDVDEECDGAQLGSCQQGPCTASCTCPFLPSCGDGSIDYAFGETCDDGNLTDGDGCDSYCRWERTSLDHCGEYALDQGPYIQEFELSLSGDEAVSFDVRPDYESCGSPGGQIEVSGESGFAHAELFYCVPSIVRLPAGDYTVAYYGGGYAGPTLHFLDGSCSVCGNGSREAEECDDGNLTAADGCSPDCQTDVLELGPCTHKQVSLSPAGHVNYLFELTTPSTVAITTSDGNGGCPGNTAVSLRHSQLGDIAYDDNSGVGECSSIVVALAAGSYHGEIHNDSWVDVQGVDVSLATSSCSVCGNGVAEAEECDDGNLTAGDGCDGQCRWEPRELAQCGTYSVDGFEDPNSDQFVLELASPQMVRLEVQIDAGCPGYDSLKVKNSDGVNVASTYDYAGDYCAQLSIWLDAGVYDVVVSRDGGTESYDLVYTNSECSSCGNGVIEAEVCDDGNTEDADGCSSDCDADTSLLNQCGDYSATEYIGNYAHQYSLSLPTETRIVLETRGVTNSCNVDTLIYLYDMTGLIAIDDDGGNYGCSRIVTTLPAGDYSVSVTENNSDFVPYVLRYRNAGCGECGNGIVDTDEECDGGDLGKCPVGPCSPSCSCPVSVDCGDGVLESGLGEQCDDGNTADGDQCDSLCRFSRPVLRPCETYDSSGSSNGGDEEVLLDVLSGGQVALRTSDGSGSCGHDTTLLVTTSENYLRGGDDDDGIGLCSYASMSLSPGRYSVEIDGAVGPFVLEAFDSTCSTCGNGLEEMEECDDGNTNDFDGCNSVCEKVPIVLSQCGTFTSAGAAIGDVDVFTITLESAGIVLLETTGQDGFCPGDSRISVRDAGNWEVLADDDGGQGDCSRLQSSLPAGTYTVRVSADAHAPSGAPFSLHYLTDECSGCGNGTVEPGEHCDDGDPDDFDNCDTDCRIRLQGCRDELELPGFTAGGSNEIRLFLPVATAVHLETASTGTTCTVDTILELRNEANTVVAFDDQSGTGPCSALTVDLPAGDYRGIVSGFGGTGLGSFLLRYDSSACSTCGNSYVETGEDCDDGDVAYLPGDICLADCSRIPCGRPVNPTADRPKASDASHALRTAVGTRACSIRICDVNGSGEVTIADALLILRSAVGHLVTLSCPP